MVFKSLLHWKENRHKTRLTSQLFTKDDGLMDDLWDNEENKTPIKSFFKWSGLVPRWSVQSRQLEIKFTPEGNLCMSSSMYMIGGITSLTQHSWYITVYVDRNGLVNFNVIRSRQDRWCSSTVRMVCAASSALSTSSLWCFTIPTLLLLACRKLQTI